MEAGARGHCTLVLRDGFDAERARGVDEVDHAVRAKLIHHAATMHLHRLLRRAEVGRDDLVELARDHVREDLALPRRELGSAGPSV